ncbi:MAG: PDZ domain-containing protein [Blastocatellia bacterium]
MTRARLIIGAAAISPTISGVLFSTKSGAENDAAQARAGARQRGPKSAFGIVGNFAFRVTTVQPASAAEEAGLRSGDLITYFAGKQVTRIEDIITASETLEPGSLVDVGYLRFDPANPESFIKVNARVPLGPVPTDWKQ